MRNLADNMDGQLMEREKISNAYHQSIFAQTEGSFRKKAIGQFYTPKDVSEALIREVFASIPTDVRKLRIIDPFCGDGSLLLRSLHFALERFGRTLDHIDIAGYDIDKSALDRASENFSKTFKHMGRTNPKIDVNWFNEDFLVSGEDGRVVAADICITNPPWLNIKASANAGHEKRDYVRLLRELYPEAVGIGAFSRISANMARIGFAAAKRAVHDGGVLGIVLPISLISDHASARLRESFSAEFALTRVETYPAELKKFKGIDQGFCWLVGIRTGAPISNISVVRHRRNGSASVEVLSRELFFNLYGGSITIPDIFGVSGMKLLRDLDKNTPISEHAGVRVFREIDETRIGEKLSSYSTLLFAKGRDIARYRIDVCKLPGIDSIYGKKYPSSYTRRVVWRDVARRSQDRRMHATIVPVGVLTGNSLGCLITESGSEDERLYYLGFLNSWLAEFQVRSLSSTNHVSTGLVKKLRWPEYDESDPQHRKLAVAAGLQMSEYREEVQQQIEKTVMRIVGWKSEYLDEILAAVDRS